MVRRPALDALVAAVRARHVDLVVCVHLETAWPAPRATWRWRRPGAAPRERWPPRQALTLADRAAVLALLHEERFVDLPPAQIWAQVLDAGQVPPCARNARCTACSRERGAASAATSSGTRLHRPESRRDGAQPGLELGHHHAPRRGQVDLLVPLRAARYLQPLCRRLACWPAGRRPPWPRGSIAESGARKHGSPGNPRAALRPRRADDLQVPGAAARRSRRHAQLQPPAHEQRQPVLREPLQNGLIRATGTFATLEHGEAWTDVLPLVQRRAPARRPWLDDAGRHSLAVAAKGSSSLEVLHAAYVAHPERFPRGVPVPPPLPTAAWINKPPAPPAHAVPEGAGS